MRARTVWMVLLLTMLLCTTAPAAIITLDQTQLMDQANWVSATPDYSPGTPFDSRATNWQTLEPGYPNVTTTGAFYTTPSIDTPLGSVRPGVSSLYFTGTGASLGLSGLSGEGFGLTVTNWNNQGWEFQIFATVGGSDFSSALASLSPGKPGESYTLLALFDMTYLIGDGDVFQLYVQLANANSDSDVPHFEVTSASVPVPEPGTIMLLGSGLVGLATWGRKRFRRPE